MQEYQALFEQAPVAMAKLDGHGYIQHINAKFAELLGRSINDLSGQPLHEIIASESNPPLENSLQDLISGKEQAWTGKCELLGWRREPCWIEITATPLAYQTNMPESSNHDANGCGIMIAVTNTLASHQTSRAWHTVFDGLVAEIHNHHNKALKREQILQILEASPDCVAMIDAEGNILFANPALNRLLGGENQQRPANLFTGQPDWAVNLIRNEALPTAAERGIWTGNSELITSSGEIIPTYQTVVAHPDTSGTPDRYSTIIRDFTAIRTAEEFQRKLLGSLAEGVFGTDLQGRFTFLNPAACRMLGFSSEQEALGHNAHLFCHYNRPDGTPFPEHDCPICQVQQTGSPLQAREDRFWRSDGSSFPVLLNVSPLYSNSRQIRGAVVSFQDISDRIEEERRYRLAQEAARFGIWEWELTNNEIHWDDASWQMLGYPALQSAHCFGYNKWRSMVNPEDLDHIERILNRHVDKGERFSFELRYISADGDWLWVQARGQTVEWNSDGTPRRIMGAHVDVNQLKETELALRRREHDLIEAKKIARLGNWSADLRANYIYWSDEIYSIFGLTKGQWAANHDAFMDTVHPDDRDSVEQALQKALNGEAPYEVEHRIVRPDGTVRSVLERGNVEIDETGEPIRILGTLQDITEQRELEDNLRRLVTILDSTPDIVAMASPDGDILYLNAAGRKYLATPDSHPAAYVWPQPQNCLTDSLNSQNKPIFAPLANSYPSWALDMINQQAIPTALREGYWRGETAIRDREGNTIPVSQVIIVHYKESGEISHISTILRDVTEQKRLEQALAHEATTDHLTGIFNRQRFDTELDKTIAKHNRYGNEAGLIMFDIDHFKVLNDTYGHDTGDQVLIELTSRVATILRETDIFARWGGEEFVVILPETDTDGITSLAERLRLDIFGKPFTHAGHISISLGASQIYPADTPNTALKRVDNALYKAKRLGRNQVIYCTEDQRCR